VLEGYHLGESGTEREGGGKKKDRGSSGVSMVWDSGRQIEKITSDTGGMGADLWSGERKKKRGFMMAVGRGDQKRRKRGGEGGFSTEYLKRKGESEGGLSAQNVLIIKNNSVIGDIAKRITI